MIETNISNLRQNISQMLGEAAKSNEKITVKTKEGNVVVMSEQDYNEYKEKMQLLGELLGDDKMKQEFQALCEDMGLSTTAAYMIFAKKVLKERRIPFEITATLPEGWNQEKTDAKEADPEE